MLIPGIALPAEPIFTFSMGLKVTTGAVSVSPYP
ncbi:MAG: hypothetical protein ACD_69C00036G0002 [uncultured bacterium]|nr:MAG: hypothetical protein ACD_69C00036G0002 [uncultured bacterium]